MKLRRGGLAVGAAAAAATGALAGVVGGAEFTARDVTSPTGAVSKELTACGNSASCGDATLDIVIKAMKANGK